MVPAEEDAAMAEEQLKQELKKAKVQLLAILSCSFKTLDSTRTVHKLTVCCFFMT